jgi:hypothetical protein
VTDILLLVLLNELLVDVNAHGMVIQNLLADEEDFAKLTRLGENESAVGDPATSL